MSKTPAIATPPVLRDNPALFRWLNDVKTILENINVVVETNVTSTVNQHVVALIGDGTILTSTGIDETSVTPPKPNGLIAIPSRTFVLLTWDPIPYGHNQHTIIYRASENNINAATEIGTSKSLVYQDYTPADGTFYYWIAFQSRGSIASPDGIIGQKSDVASVTVDSKISNTNISEYFYPDSVGSDYVFASTLAAITASLGDVVAGTLSNPDGTFMVDLVNKYIQIAGPNGWESDDYIRIENGSIEQKTWTGVTHQDAQALNVIETGIADNGDTVYLSKYYKSQPQVIVTPYSTQTYSAAYSSQDQKLECYAENLTKITAGNWKFDAVSRLVLASGSGSIAVNDSFTGSGSLTSNTYTTELNTTSVSVSSTVMSVRGTGTVPTYYYRTAHIHGEYRAAGSSNPWSSTITVDVDIGATITNSQTRGINMTFPSAGQWEFRIVVSYSDTGGTFTSGSVQYDYNTDTVNLASDTQIFRAYSSDSSSVTTEADITLPTYSPPAGYSVYEVNYHLSYAYYLYISGSLADVARVTGPLGDSGIYHVRSGEGTTGDVNLPTATDTYDFTQSSYNNVLNNILTCYARGGTAGYWSDVAESKTRLFTDTSATIKSRKAQNNSTTADNDLTINLYRYETSGSTQVSAGTLQWQAIL